MKILSGHEKLREAYAILDDYLYFDLIRKQGMSRIDIQTLLPRLVAPYPISPHHLP